MHGTQLGVLRGSDCRGRLPVCLGGVLAHLPHPRPTWTGPPETRHRPRSAHFAACLARRSETPRRFLRRSASVDQHTHTHTHAQTPGLWQHGHSALCREGAGVPAVEPWSPRPWTVQLAADVEPATMASASGHAAICFESMYAVTWYLPLGTATNETWCEPSKQSVTCGSSFPSCGSGYKP
jgi:hypothetical protein